jgi:ligand-binding SRPBCC domain-containing protein
MARFEYETVLDCSRQGLFEFLLRPANVARIADPNTGLNILSAPEVVDVGSRIEFQLIGFGQVQQAVHEIVELIRPQRIVEVQVQGPLKSWHHQHLFEANGGGVRMIDIIDFQPPGGVLGLIVNEARLSASLEEGFFARQQQLEQLIARGELH